MVFEACKRRLEEIGETHFDIEKYEFTIHMCEYIELGEVHVAGLSRLFTPGNPMRPAQLRQGYQNFNSYVWLRENASIEGQYEMQTIIPAFEMPHEIANEMTRMRATFLRQRAALVEIMDAEETPQ